MNPASRCLTVTQLAAYFRCAPWTIYRMVRGGALPYFRVGTHQGTGEYRFDVKQIEAWQSKQKEIA